MSTQATLSDAAEIREALTHLAASAGRMLRTDAIGRRNIDWEIAHHRINVLLDELERADQPSSAEVKEPA